MPDYVIKACLCDRFIAWFSLGRGCVESDSNVHGLISDKKLLHYKMLVVVSFTHGEYNLTEKVCYLNVDRGCFCFVVCFFVFSSIPTWTAL